MNREHLIVEEYVDKKFIKIYCTEGHHITNWDGVDYRNYTGATMMYCPIGFDYSSYYCVDEETHKKNMEEHMKVMEEERKREEQERMNPTVSGYTNEIISGTTI